MDPHDGGKGAGAVDLDLIGNAITLAPALGRHRGMREPRRRIWHHGGKCLSLASMGQWTIVSGLAR